MTEPVKGTAPDGAPVLWDASRHLIVHAPARTGGTTLLTRLAARHDGAYINVASAHVPDPADHPNLRMAVGDDLDRAIGLLHGKPRVLAVDGMEYWLRGPDTPFDNPENDPRIAAWNQRMRRSTHLRAIFRDRLRRLVEEDGCRLIMGFRTGRADDLLGKWPVGVTPGGCDRLELSKDGRFVFNGTVGRMDVR